MKVSKKEIAKVVKKKYESGRQFCRVCPGGYYQIMIDISDGHIWLDTYVCENSWSVYHSDSIYRLNYVPGYVNETEKGYIDSAIELLTAAGWEVVDDGEK